MNKELWCVFLDIRDVEGIYSKHSPFSTCRHRFDAKQKRFLNSDVFESHQSWVYRLLLDRANGLSEKCNCGENGKFSITKRRRVFYWIVEDKSRLEASQFLTKSILASLKSENCNISLKLTPVTHLHHATWALNQPASSLKTSETSFNSVVYFEIFDQESCHSNATKLMTSPPGERLQNIGIP